MKKSGIHTLTITKGPDDKYQLTGCAWPQRDQYNKLYKINVTDDSKDLEDLLEELVRALDYLGYIKH